MSSGEDTIPRVQKIPEAETKLYHIFADETCQVDAGKVKHEWMALGTTNVSDEHLDHVRAMFVAWKVKMKLHGEIKWKKTDKKNVARYKTLVTVYFNLLKRGILQFHAMTIPRAGFNPKALGNEVPEAAYNRCFHYLLLWRYCAGHPEDRRPLRERKYFVLFDKRTSLVPWKPFQLAVCRAANRDYGMDHWPFRRVEYEESHLEIMLQANDLILGAVGFWWNKKHSTLPTSKSPKGKLARHVAKHVKEATGSYSMFQIPYKSRDYTIWRMAFNERGEPEKQAVRP